MSQKKKLYAKLCRNVTPKDILYSDVLALLLQYGFVEIHSTGDHVMFKHSKYIDIILSLDSNGKRTIKPCYVKNIRKAIDEVIDRGGCKL